MQNCSMKILDSTIVLTKQVELDNYLPDNIGVPKQTLHVIEEKNRVPHRNTLECSVVERNATVCRGVKNNTPNCNALHTYSHSGSDIYAGCAQAADLPAPFAENRAFPARRRLETPRIIRTSLRTNSC